MFSKTSQKGKVCYIAKQVCSMLDFVTDNIYATFEGDTFQQQIDIPMGTNRAHLLTNLYSYETEFLRASQRTKI